MRLEAIYKFTGTDHPKLHGTSGLTVGIWMGCYQCRLHPSVGLQVPSWWDWPG